MWAAEGLGGPSAAQALCVPQSHSGDHPKGLKLPSINAQGRGAGDGGG